MTARAAYLADAYVPIGDLSTTDGIVLAAGGRFLVPPDFDLVVHGDPTTQGSKKPMPVYRGKGADRTFTGRVYLQEQNGERLDSWREAVRASTARQLPPGWTPITDAVLVAMFFTLAKAKPRTKAEAAQLVLPVKAKKDTSKYQRSTEDALVDGGLIADDSLIVDYVAAAKRYPGERPGALYRPGALVLVWKASPLLRPLYEAA